jgi:hypothetical protein
MASTTSEPADSAGRGVIIAFGVGIAVGLFVIAGQVPLLHDVVGDEWFGPAMFADMTVPIIVVVAIATAKWGVLGMIPAVFGAVIGLGVGFALLADEFDTFGGGMTAIWLLVIELPLTIIVASIILVVRRRRRRTWRRMRGPARRTGPRWCRSVGARVRGGAPHAGPSSLTSRLCVGGEEGSRPSGHRSSGAS